MSTKIPKKLSVLGKIIEAIRSSPPTSSGGVSRVSITKYLKSELEYDNASQIKLALKRGVSNGTLKQKGQSFVVANDPPRSIPPQGEPLKIEDVKKGSGDTVAERGDAVTVQYLGKLEDKTTFDSSKNFEFVLGAGDVIKGWDQGLVGMAVHGKRKLVVPSHLGYGKRGCAPDIPPNATLYFDVTMKSIVKQED
jgi:FKBP-type peptidyl-prolyl cis-trans isomerase